MKSLYVAHGFTKNSVYLRFSRNNLTTEDAIVIKEKTQQADYQLDVHK